MTNAAIVHDTEIEVFSSAGTPLRKWGNPGSRNGEFYLPQGIAVDGTGKVIVADSGNDRVQVFDSLGTFVAEFGDGYLSRPYGIAVADNDNAYVVDQGLQAVLVFDSAGNFLRRWGSITYEGGKLEFPAGIDLDGSGSVYVTNESVGIVVFDSVGNFLREWDDLVFPFGIAIDAGDTVYATEREFNFSQIHAFDRFGNTLRILGSNGSGNGQFEAPHDLAVDTAGNIYVADYGNHRIQVLDSAGNFLRKWGTYGSGDGQFINPTGVAVDINGNVYVVDYGNDRIQVFDTFGRFLGKWGSYGTAVGFFDGPLYVATDKTGARVYVSDTGNSRVQVFAGFGAPPLPSPWATQDIGSVGMPEAPVTTTARSRERFGRRHLGHCRRLPLRLPDADRQWPDHRPGSLAAEHKSMGQGRGHDSRNHGGECHHAFMAVTPDTGAAF